MATVSEPIQEGTDLAGGVVRRTQRLLKAQVEDWYDVCRYLADWEDRFLLDQPTPERLAQHSLILDELERVGKWLSLATGSSDFPDTATSRLVAMTLQDLKDTRSLWHGKTSKEERQKIMRAVFNES
jgi:hypothetical protein